MIIKEEELKTCLLFALKPYLEEYGFHILGSSLTIENKIFLKALMQYQNQTFHVDVSFELEYQQYHFVFKEIEGKAKYSFIELPFMQIFKQFVKIPNLDVGDNRCSYPLALPISQIIMKKNHLIVKIRD